jgi:hypothetical protein
MHRRDFSKLLAGLGGFAMVPGIQPVRALAAEPRRWSFRADVAECCSCSVPCPCNFGRPVDTCFGNRLIQIREGDFEGAPLGGISFLVTFQMGRWTRIHIDESLSAARSATLDALLPVAFAGFNNLARAKERVPLTVEASADGLRFSVPDSAVEMRLVAGLGGEPIRISGLPSPAFHDYVQYESVVHRHSSADGEWSYSATNGFRSEMRASG